MNEYNYNYEQLDKDRKSESKWLEFSDIPLDENDCLEHGWDKYPAGTEKEEIWEDFDHSDKEHSKGIVYLLYHFDADRYYKEGNYIDKLKSGLDDGSINDKSVITLDADSSLWCKAQAYKILTEAGFKTCDIVYDSDGKEQVSFLCANADLRKAVNTDDEYIQSIMECDGSLYAKHREEVVEWLKSELKDICGEDMCYDVEPTSYDDYLREETVLKAVYKFLENPESYCHDFLVCIAEETSDIFVNADDYLFEEIKNRAYAEGQEFYDKFCEVESDDINEAFSDATYQGPLVHYDDFLNNDYHVNIMLATEAERNYDMGAIHDFFENPERIVYDNPENDNRWDNALTYLIRQQGHGVEEVLKLYDKYEEEWKKYTDDPSNNELPDIEDSFVGTVADELINDYAYSMQELTTLSTLRGQNLIDVINRIASGEGYLEFSKNCYLGLHNEWQGSSSQLGIELEKPAVFPTSMVRNIQIEKAGRDIIEGYSVDDVNGLIGKCWRGSCEITDEVPELYKENNKTRARDGKGRDI